MLSILFMVLMVMVFGKIFFFAIRAAWGVSRIIFSVVFLPFLLFGLALSGLVYIAIPILIVLGILTLVADHY